MLSELKQYLLRVKAYSKLDPREECEVVRELQTHFEDEVRELREAGLSAAEAMDVAQKRFGNAKALGSEMYEVYSVGTWGQALLAAMPHLLIAFTFAFHLWRDNFWIIAISLAGMGVTVYAWCRGKPSWSYSWLGYLLIPLFVVSFIVLLAIARYLSQFVLDGSMQWVVIVIYIPVALWLLVRILINAIRRDWLFASFMLLPFPIIAVWLFVLEQDIGLMEYGKSGFRGADQGIAWAFLALGGAAGAFIRLRRRLLKVVVLAVATLLILAMVWRFTDSGLNPILSLLVSLSLVSFLLSPVLLQNKVASRSKDIEAWDEAWLRHAAKRS